MNTTPTHHRVDLDVSIFETDIRGVVARRLRVAPEAIAALHILRRSVDARNHRDVRFVLSVAVELPGHGRPEAGATAACFALPDAETLPSCRLPNAAPVVVGCGPAGLFAALALAESGLPPLLIDRGRPVTNRQADVNRFWNAGELDPESNMYFGEGGAGTFSDGKLNTRSKSPLVFKVLHELVQAGAPPEILFDAKPHLGTDRLLTLLPRLRERLLALGVRFQFGSRLSDLRRRADGRLELAVNDDWLEAYPLVLAAGHSALDTYRLLLARDVVLEAKNNAVGLRIEHPAALITRQFQGPSRRVLEALGQAGYTLTTALPAAAGAGSVYTFCCCPGGEVVACAAVPGQLSVNGMSYSARHGAFTNAGLVTTVQAAELGTTPAAILAWRERTEALCFQLGGDRYRVPAQRAEDFLAGRASSELPENSSRRPLTPANLDALFPKNVGERLRAGLQLLDRKVPGWIRHGLLLGVETTTSAPLRILRTASGESVTFPGLLPVGEGSGYAGGIVTSAVDGYRTVAAWLHAHA